MTWTTDKPTVPGFYWHDDCKPPYDPFVVEVRARTADGGLFVMEPGRDDDNDVTSRLYEGTRWLGPIPMPETPL